MELTLNIAMIQGRELRSRCRTSSINVLGVWVSDKICTVPSFGSFVLRRLCIIRVVSDMTAVCIDGPALQTLDRSLVVSGAHRGFRFKHCYR